VSSPSPAKYSCRGFNLIETAIVLGVIGLVVGGIWAAHSSMKTSQIAEQTFNGVTTMARELLPLFPLSVLAQDNNMNNASVRQRYADTAINLLSGKLDGFVARGNSYNGTTFLDTPIGTVNGYTAGMGFYPSSSTYFGSEGLRIGIMLHDVPQNICRRLIARVKGLMDSDLQGHGLFKGIYFNGAPYGGSYSWQALYVHQQYYNGGHVYRYDAGACAANRNELIFQINTPSN
jgi:hypothetical protein